MVRLRDQLELTAEPFYFNDRKKELKSKDAVAGESKPARLVKSNCDFC